MPWRPRGFVAGCSGAVRRRCAVIGGGIVERGLAEHRYVAGPGAEAPPALEAVQMAVATNAMAAAVERLKLAEYTVRLDFTETLLGSRPTQSIAARWVREQEKDRIERELRSGRRHMPESGRVAGEDVPDVAEGLIAGSTGDEAREGTDLAVTGFSVSPDGRLHLWDFQLMGFLKAVAQTLELKIPGKRVDAISALTQIQRLTWVYGTGSDDPWERRLWLRRPDGACITEPEPELMDRPLRAQTAQGERVSIAISEQLHPPVWCEARIVLLRGCKVSREQLEDIFAYGMFQGLGQWRGAGWGRFQATIEQTR